MPCLCLHVRAPTCQSFKGGFDVVGFGIGGSVLQEVEQIDQICCIEATFLRRRRPAKAHIHADEKWPGFLVNWIPRQLGSLSTAESVWSAEMDIERGMTGYQQSHVGLEADRPAKLVILGIDSALAHYAYNGHSKSRSYTSCTMERVMDYKTSL